MAEAEPTPEPAAPAKPAAPTQAWLEAFVSSGCIPLVFDAVQRSLLTPGKDLAFYRELANLMVLMLSSILHFHASGATSSQDLSETTAASRQKAGAEAAEEASGPTQPASSRESGEPTAAAAEPPATGVDAAAEVAAPASRQPSDAMSVDLGGDLLKDCVSMLMVLCLRASCFWGLPQASRAVMPLERNPELVIIKDILALLNKLHETFPDTVELLQAHPEACELVEALLLNREKEVRVLGANALARLYVQGEVEASAHEWLLRLLVTLLPRAKDASQHGEEFFELLQHVVKSMPAPLLHSEYTLGEELLRGEVEWLRAMVDAAHVDMTVLEGSVKVVRALAQALDKRAVGCEGQPSLIQLLLEYYLFPEALQPRDMENAVVAAGTLDRLVRRCDWASSRKQVYELLADLMLDSPANYKEGVKSLQRLHFQHTNYKGQRTDYAPVRDFFAKPLQQIELRPPPPSFVGLKNAGATCYMNSVLQQLYMQPRIRELVLSASEVDEQDKPDSLFHQLQVVFAQLLLSHMAYVIPRGFWQAFKDYDGEPIDLRDHQDAYEFFTRLQDSIDQHLKSSGQTPAIQAVMGGKFAQQIICKGVDYRSEREEEFYQISVDVRGKGSLEKSLASYVQGELMEGENAYYCEEVGKRVSAVRRSCIKELPHTLVIHLKRFDYDHYTLQRSKVRDRFEFPAALDMFRYTAEGLAALESGEASHSSSTLPRSQYMYELKGIVVHAGSAFAGHYYSYIKERPKQLPDGSVVPGQWWCFDDKVVRPWDISNLEADCYGGKASEDSSNPHRQFRGNDLDRAHSAYMLFYERHSVDSSAAGSSSPTRAASGPTNMDVSPGPGPSAASQVPMELGTPQVAAPAVAPEPGSAGGSGGQVAVGPVQPQTPYSMPYSIFEGVVRHNMDIRYRHRLHDKAYFRFMRQLIEVKWDGRSQHKKARRGTRLAAGQHIASSSDGSPSSSLDQEGRALSHRNDELRRVARDTLDMGVDFLFKVWFRAPRELRNSLDQDEMQYVLGNLLRNAPLALQAMMARLTQDNSGAHLLEMLVHYGQPQGSQAYSDLIGIAASRAAQLGKLHAYLYGPGDVEVELDELGRRLHHLVQSLGVCLHECLRLREGRLQEPRLDVVVLPLQHYVRASKFGGRHIQEHFPEMEKHLVDLLDMLSAELEPDVDGEVQDDVHAMLGYAQALFYRISNLHQLVEEEVEAGGNPYVSRSAVRLDSKHLPGRLWQELSANHTLLQQALALASPSAQSQAAPMMSLLRMLVWNNEYVLCPLAHLLQHHILHQVPKDLQAWEPQLEQLYVDMDDLYAEERVRLMLDGTVKDTLLQMTHDTEKNALLAQVLYCYKQGKHWHVMWRMRHIGGMLGRPGAVGETAAAVLKEHFFVPGGQVAPQWRDVLTFMCNWRNLRDAELAAMGQEAMNMLGVLFNQGG